MNKNNFLKIFVLFSILLLITSCVKNKTYNINYISSYGDLSNVIKEYDGTIDVELPSLYAFGYKFLGWYDNSDYTGEVITKIHKGSSGDKTFYAKWSVVLVPPNDNNKEHNFDGKSMNFVIKVESVKQFDPFNSDYIGLNKSFKQAHQKDIEAKYNIKIQYSEWEKDAAWGYERINKIKNDYIFGELEKNNIYVMEISSEWIPTLVKSSCLAELYNYGTEKGYFDEYCYMQDDIINQATSVRKEVYGYKVGVARPDNFMFYNANKVADLNIDDPAELWLKGEWTWSKFDSWVKEAQTKLADDEFTIDAGYADFLIGAAPAQGNRLVNASRMLPMFSKKAITSVIEKIQYYYANGYWNKNRGLEVVSNDFINGKSLLHNGSFNLLNQSVYYDQFTSLSFELGIVPYPIDDNTTAIPYTAPYTYEDTQGNKVKVTEPLKNRKNETLTTNTGDPIYGLDLSESNFLISYDSVNCYSIVNYAGDRLNGINTGIIFDILSNLTDSSTGNLEFESLTKDEQYYLSLSDIVTNTLDKNVLISVQDTVYYDPIKSWSCLATLGAYDHEDSFSYVIKELVVNNPGDFEVLKDLYNTYLEMNNPLG